MQYALHALMISLSAFLVTQMTLSYTNSFYGDVSPATVSAYDYSEKQATQPGLSPFGFLSFKMVFLEMGVYFLINAMLLYLSIFFLVSIMNDLS